MNKIYDALIIGSGPAGLSAALALARVHRTCIVFSNAHYRNKGATAHSILTRDHTPSEDILALGRRDVERYGSVDFVETTITSVSKPMGSGHDEFVAANASHEQWHGRTLVLATGVRDIFPALPGYVENWPDNIYQCLFCDGHERSNLPVGVLTYPKWSPMYGKMATMAHFLTMPAGAKSEGKSNVTLFTNGVVDDGEEVNRTALQTCAAHGIKVDQRQVVRLEKAVDGERGLCAFGSRQQLHDGEGICRLDIA